MPVTDIKVSGSARDVRTPDRAEVRLQISKWGREWESIHRSVTAAVGGLTDAIKKIETIHPQALCDHSISQISHRTWTDDIGAAYSETVDVAVVFTDFQVMSQWIFAQSTETIHIHGITWDLSPAAKSELSISLSVEAIRDARRRAETFAVAAGLAIVGIQTLADTELTGGVIPPTVLFARKVSMPEGASEGGIDITPAPIETTVKVEAHFLAEPDPDSSPFPTTQPTNPSLIA